MAEEIQQMAEEIKRLTLKRKNLKAKLKHEKLRKLFPQKIELPIIVPFELEDCRVTHLFKDRKSRISLGYHFPQDMRGGTPETPYFYVGGLSPMTLYLPYIYLPRQKGKNLIVKGKFIIESLEWVEQ